MNLILPEEKRLQVEERIETEINNRTSSRLAVICDPTYYKNKYLKYAFIHNTSPQCIQRVYAEMLKEGYKYTGDGSDLFHLSQLIGRLKVITDEGLLSYVNSLVTELTNAMKVKYQYLIVEVIGRIKSFKSFEAKIRTRLMKRRILNEILLDVNRIFTNPEEVTYAKLFIRKQIDSIATNIVSDTIGLRIILYSKDKNRDEDFLTKFVCSEFFDFIVGFFETRGAEVSEVKDYVSFPKNNGYKSIHFKIEVMGENIEVQLRTAGMHEISENGAAAHSVYKNTQIQNFVRDFMYEISGEAVKINEKMGLLREQTLNPTMWCFVPQSEIPRSPGEVAKFGDTEFIREVMKNQPK